MKNRAILVLLFLFVCYGVVKMAVGYSDETGEQRREESGRHWVMEQVGQAHEGGGGQEERGGGQGGQHGGGGSTGGKSDSGRFLLHDAKHVIRTEAGDMKVVRNFNGRIREKHMHIGFLNMEPKSLFVPQYLDSSLIIFVHRGEARVACIFTDTLQETLLKTGDLYRIPTGSTFYLENTGVGQRLQIICSIDTSESLGSETFESFYIGGGTSPTSILAGFDLYTLVTAFNVSVAAIKEILTPQTGGSIVFTNQQRAPPSIWTEFVKLDERERLQHLKRMVGSQVKKEEDDKEQSKWSWKNVLATVFNKGKDSKKPTPDSPKSCNVYKKKPDFRNDFGWTKALDESNCKVLQNSGIGVFYVNLTAGAMLAPHMNPRASEYGIVLSGSGTIQIVNPNGTTAMNTQVKKGDVFYVPRYYAFCQIASRTGPFEFFGFTTSGEESHAMFFPGENALLQLLNGPELAVAFGVNETKMDRVVKAQHGAVIIPTPSAAPPYEKEDEFRVPTEVAMTI